MQYIEYIETDGSEICFQLTNANISTSNDIVSFDFMPLNGTTHYDGFYAFAQGSLFIRTWYAGYQVDNARYQVIFYGNSWSEGQGPVWNVNTKYECVFNNRYLVRNGTGYRYYHIQSDFTGPIIVNGEYDGSTISRCPVGRYYRCAIERNGVLVCDYRPVLDNNNVPCFYDEVSETYCYNLGNGTPIAGPIIGPPAPAVPTDLVIGGKTVNSINIGGKDVVSIYDGTTLLWEKPVTPQPTQYPVLEFTAKQANSSIGMTNTGGNTPVIYYSTDKTYWTLWDYSAITLANINDKVYFYGENPNGFSSPNKISTFTMTGSIEASGDVTTLLQINTTTTIPNANCFEKLFYNCTALTTAPTLPATTLDINCYHSMFKGCTSLTTAPTLPVTTMVLGCYNSMFQGCTSLASAPALPATTLANTCYAFMFSNCTSLATAPVLPATTLDVYCYGYMFENCTSLTTAPDLSASTLATECYYGMFYGCANLNSITCLATDISATNCTTNWVDGVSASGTFTRECSMLDWTTGVNGIPSGWTVLDNCPPPTPTDPDMLHFTAQQANSSVGLNVPSGLNLTLYKSTDGVNFSSWDGTAVTLSNIGDTLWVYGTNNKTAIDSNSYSNFTMSGQIAAAGDVTYLLQNGGTTTLTSSFALCGLFANCTALTTAPELPATTLTDYCYDLMFYKSGITTAPTLNATTLASDCYSYMFSHCTSLVNVQASLPATTIPSDAYRSMFEHCYSLTTAPNLPATNVGLRGYISMFEACINLVNVQQSLPATTLGKEAYEGMFRYCQSLVNAPALPCTTLSTDCYNSMFRDCISLVNAPALPASTIAGAAYSFMFLGCTSLQSINVSATSWNTQNSASWVYNVPSGGTFTKRSGTTIPTGDDGIPTGWTVVNV